MRFGFLATLFAALALALPAVASAAPEFSLTITENGTGSGTVECEVEEGPLEPCEAKYPAGTEVVLVAEADPKSEFIEWSGDCGPLDCELTMDQDHSATVTFDLEPVTEFALDVETEGSGSGTVECEAQEGPEPCKAEYPEATELTLLANPALGSEFVEWTGDCSGSTCELTMDEAHSVTAVFDLEPGFPLTIKTEGSGSGTVKCKVGVGPAGACAAQYPEETELTLLANPALGSEFVEWTGDCSGSTCELTMDEAHSVTAVFDLEPGPIVFALTVSKGGAGTGTVTSSPSGVNCGATCTAKFDEGTEVTLTAIPASGSTFTGWSGSGCSGTGTCTVTMNQARSVTATFGKAPAPSPGKAVVAGAAQVKGGKALLKLTCKGPGRCAGALKLIAKLKVGKGKAKKVTVGKGTVSLAAAVSTMLKVKLSGQAKQALEKGGSLKVKVTGSGVQGRSVKLMRPF